MRKDNKNIPTYRDLIIPTFIALKELGGSGTNNEIYEQVVNDMNYPDEVLDYPHLGSQTQTEIQYQLAWSRTYLKHYGAIENNGRSVWALTSKFSQMNPSLLNPTEIIAFSSKKNSNKDQPFDDNDDNDVEEYPDENKPWRTKLSSIIQSMDPFAFERLCQRVLRENGFEDVRVTKKSGDGGIDGTGKLIIGGLISFNIAFQCKRYKNSVSSSEIRDFRGSMNSNIEKGIFITTGIFTEGAKKEANSIGKQQIDLVDGEKFIGAGGVSYYRVMPTYHNQTGEKAYIMKARAHLMKDLGTVMSPLNAFLIIQSCMTLSLRVNQHCKNALEIAKFLKDHEAVSWVNYPGLEDNENHEMAEKYLNGNYGCIVSFGIKGGIEEGKKFIESVELLSHVANIADAKTLVIHPASTTHSNMTEEEQLDSGITPDFIRMSVGIEDVRDLIEDIDQALKKAIN